MTACTTCLPPLHICAVGVEEWIAIAIAVAKGNRNGGAKAHLIVLHCHICEQKPSEPNTLILKF